MNDVNDKIFMVALTAAMQQGFNPILQRLDNQPNLSKEIFNSINQPKVILGVEASIKLKHYAEGEKIRKYESMLTEIEDLSRIIEEELK